MKLDELIEMYRVGAITGYQVMMDCLQMIDPGHPELVLALLPDEILEEMLNYSIRFDSSRMSYNEELPPTSDQVIAARHWIVEKRQRKTQRNIGATSEQ